MGGGDGRARSKVLGRVFGWREERSSSGIRVSGCLAAAVGWWGQCGALRWVDRQDGVCVGVWACPACACLHRKSKSKSKSEGPGTPALSGWVKNRKRLQPCRTWKAFARAGGNWTEGGGGDRRGREGATSTLGTACTQVPKLSSQQSCSSIEACTVVPPV